MKSSENKVYIELPDPTRPAQNAKKLFNYWMWTYPNNREIWARCICGTETCIISRYRNLGPHCRWTGFYEWYIRGNCCSCLQCIFSEKVLQSVFVMMNVTQQGQSIPLDVGEVLGYIEELYNNEISLHSGANALQENTEGFMGTRTKRTRG